MYLAVNKNTPKISIFQSNEKDIIKYSEYANLYKNRFFLNSKKYFSILNQLEKKQPYQIKHVNGQVFIFNGFIPHQAIREGSEVRLSLDFRIKTKILIKTQIKGAITTTMEDTGFYRMEKKMIFFRD